MTSSYTAHDDNLADDFPDRIRITRGLSNKPGKLINPLPDLPALAAQARAGRETRITDETTGGEKGRKLYRYDLIPGDALHELALHYGLGSTKYEDRNWERGYPWSLSFGALQRHAWAFWRGEDIDPEVGTSHATAAAWHALNLEAFRLRGIGKDDRP